MQPFQFWLVVSAVCSYYSGTISLLSSRVLRTGVTDHPGTRAWGKVYVCVCVSVFVSESVSACACACACVFVCLFALRAAVIRTLG